MPLTGAELVCGSPLRRQCRFPVSLTDIFPSLGGGDDSDSCAPTGSQEKASQGIVMLQKIPLHGCPVLPTPCK
jgi:hypothetical protein